MTLRTFTDASGTSWEVRAVYPHTSGSYPRYEGPRDEGGRPNDGASAVSPPDGWLQFTSRAGARRRFAPLPTNWQTAPDDELARLCEAAVALPVAPTANP